MTDLALAAGLAATIGGVLAISSRDNRLAVGGLLLCMLAVPLVASPVPPALTIAFRSIGALLAAYLLWVPARAAVSSSEGVGMMAEIPLAAAAFAIGWVVTPVRPLAGPVAAQAAGFALVALAMAPLIGRNVMRIGIATAVLTLGLSLMLGAWAGPTSPMGQMALMLLLVGILGATSLLMSPHDAAAAVDATETVVPTVESDDATAAPTEGGTSIAAEAPARGAPKRSAAPKATQEKSADMPTDQAGQPDGDLETGFAKGSETLRTSTARSPRAIRQRPPVRPADRMPDVTAEPAPEPPTAARVRRIRPREPRQ